MNKFFKNRKAMIYLAAIVLAIIVAASNVKEKPMEPEISTKPIKIVMPTAMFLVPRNHFSPRNKDYPDEKKLDDFGAIFFLPSMDGYTESTAKYFKNYYEIRNQVIEVIHVRNPSRFGPEGRPLPPSAWGDVDAIFATLHHPDHVPVYTINGLECHGFKGRENMSGNAVHCIGIRSNGEKLYMRAASPPEEPDDPFQCEVQYWSEQARLYIRYRYSRNQIERWREIDDAVWIKLNAWRIK